MIRPNKKFGFTLPTRRERSTLRSRRAIALSEGGFTLVEVLIAAVITVVIVVMLGLMLGSLMSSASHASQRVDAFRDARAALQMMERDFSNPGIRVLRTAGVPLITGAFAPKNTIISVAYDYRGSMPRSSRVAARNEPSQPSTMPPLTSTALPGRPSPRSANSLP